MSYLLPGENKTNDTLVNVSVIAIRVLFVMVVLYLFFVLGYTLGKQDGMDISSQPIVYEEYM